MEKYRIIRDGSRVDKLSSSRAYTQVPSGRSRCSEFKRDGKIAIKVTVLEGNNRRLSFARRFIFDASAIVYKYILFRFFTRNRFFNLLNSVLNVNILKFRVQNFYKFLDVVLTSANFTYSLLKISYKGFEGHLKCIILSFK